MVATASISNEEETLVTVLRPIPRQAESVTDQAYRTIREAIVSRQLNPGQRIVESTLAEQLGVSKTPVREALLRLASVGLIESDGTSRGGRVVTPSYESIRSAYEIRMALEVEVARIVAGRGTPGDVAVAREHADNCLERAQFHDRQGFRERDRDFHLDLAQATKNPILARLVSDSFDLTWTLRLRDAPVASDSLECAEQHVKVMEAIKRNDVEAASVAMREHIAKVEGIVLGAYGENQER